MRKLKLLPVLLITLILTSAFSTQQKTTLTISAVGDLTLGTDETFGYPGSFLEVFFDENQDFSYFLGGVSEFLQADDLTIGNLEGPLTRETAKADKTYRFKGYPTLVNLLTSGGVEAVNLANNHTFDYFEKGYEDTLETLKTADVASFGYDAVSLLEIKGIKVGLSGHNLISKHGNVLQELETNIPKLQEMGADLIIVSFHWGTEGTAQLTDSQKHLGRLAVDLGADLVLGHHPHVLQGIEEYQGKYIVYSLANFCFGGNRNPKDKDTFIFQQTFTFQGTQLQPTQEITLIPALVSSVKYRNDYRPAVAEGEDKRRIQNRLTSYSTKADLSEAWLEEPG